MVKKLCYVPVTTCSPSKANPPKIYATNIITISEKSTLSWLHDFKMWDHIFSQIKLLKYVILRSGNYLKSAQLSLIWVQILYKKLCINHVQVFLTVCIWKEGMFSVDRSQIHTSRNENINEIQQPYWKGPLHGTLHNRLHIGAAQHTDDKWTPSRNSFICLPSAALVQSVNCAAQVTGAR